MTIKSRKKIAKKRILKRKQNPSWIDKILGRTKELKDSYSIEIDAGVIIVTGKEGLETVTALKKVLTASQKNVKIQFYARSSPNKGYILNRPEEYVKEDIERAERRSEGWRGGRGLSIP